jgi:Zn-dependent protease with chaperone function
VAITLTCSNCQETLGVEDEFAGRKGKCPKCQTILLIPAAGGAAAAKQQQAKPQAAVQQAINSQPKPQQARQPAVPQAAAKQAGANGGALRPQAATAPAAVGGKPQVQRPVGAQQVAAVQRVAAKPKLTPEQAAAELRNRVLGGFRGEIEPVGTSLMYKLAILATALLMVVLPLIYVAIIGLVCLAVWMHLTHSHVIFESVRGRAVLMALVIYAAPLVIGAIVIAFMFKPLLARPANEGRRRTVTPLSDPLLFEFVERVCELVGAPQPRRIDIDCQINASAGFRRGWLSLLTGRDLVLTIGMPLVAGLSLKQFAGVLAHEFGHFSQGAGMRLSYVVRSINMWFVRVVYQRDAWDEWLESISGELDWRIGWVFLVAQGCVWVTRKILWCLMYIGHIVAGFMMRQMEFDADKYETRLAGSETFGQTARQLRLLGLAWQGAEADLASYYREGRLADNLPKLMLGNLKQLPQEAREFVTKLIAETKTGIFDSHPSDQDRIDAARAEQTSGVFDSNLPATALFANFDTAAKGVTWDHYCAVMGKIIDPKSLFSTEELVARTDSLQSAAQARDRFFGGGFTVLRPQRLPMIELGKTQHAAIWQEELAAARKEMETLAPACVETVKTLDQADTRLIQARQARSVLSTGVRLQTQRFEQSFDSLADATKKRDAALTEISRVGNRLEAFEVAAGQRLRADMMLLCDPTVARRIEGGAALQAEARQLLPLVSQISSLHASMIELRNCHATLGALLGHIEGNERSQSLVNEVLDYTKRVRAQTADLRGPFERVDYPFDHAKGPLSVASYFVSMVPPADEIGAVYDAADQVLNKFVELGSKAISRLCQIAELVERDQGYEVGKAVVR